MKKIIILILFLLVFAIGCSSSEDVFNDMITYKGKSANWQAEIKFSFNEKLVPVNKDSYTHTSKTRHSGILEFIGPKGIKIKTVNYSYTLISSNSKFSGSDTFDGKPYTIKTIGGGSETSSKVPAESVDLIKLGGYKHDFPEKNEEIIFKIKWDGKVENIQLKPE